MRCIDMYVYCTTSNTHVRGNEPPIAGGCVTIHVCYKRIT
jgi:hypothetical protein